MTAKTRFLFGKGVVETIQHVQTAGKTGYYELYKQGFVVSRQTFADMLKLLEKKGILSRKVIDERPPRVEYSLTEKGKEVAEILRRLDRSL